MCPRTLSKPSERIAPAGNQTKSNRTELNLNAHFLSQSVSQIALTSTARRRRRQSRKAHIWQASDTDICLVSFVRYFLALKRTDQMEYSGLLLQANCPQNKAPAKRLMQLFGCSFSQTLRSRARQTGRMVPSWTTFV